jgi:hypothetical protein
LFHLAHRPEHIAAHRADGDVLGVGLAKAIEIVTQR